MPVGAAILAGAAISGGVSAYGAHKKNKQAGSEQQRVQQLVDQWLKQYQGYQGGLQSDFGAGGQYHDTLFGPRTTTQDSTSSSETTPTITPQMSPLVGMATKAFEGRLKRGSSLPPGYEEAQARTINDSFAGLEQSDKDIFARQGKAYTDVGSPVAYARASKLADLHAGLPLAERQMETEDLTGASKLAETFGKGSKTSSRSHASVTSPADIGAILQYFNMLAPPQPPIVGAAPYTSPLSAGLSSGLDAASLIQLLMSGRGGKIDPGAVGGFGGTEFDPTKLPASYLGGP